MSPWSLVCRRSDKRWSAASSSVVRVLITPSATAAAMSTADSSGQQRMRGMALMLPTLLVALSATESVVQAGHRRDGGPDEPARPPPPHRRDAHGDAPTAPHRGAARTHPR